MDARTYASANLAARDVLTERLRQRHQFPDSSDDAYKGRELALAGASYAWAATLPDSAQPAPQPFHWPWAAGWWKPRNRRRALVKAAALLLAEIDRIDRAGGQGG